MYLSLNWIKKFVAVPEIDPAQLALDLTMSTVEVEDVIIQSQQFDGLVIGRIVELAKHPQADRLWICKTDIGGETVQIVCGGSNLREGMLVMVATVGSRVRWHGEGDFITLEKAKIRGQESVGMIVASSEVGLEQLFPASDEHEIVDVSDFNFKVGTSVAEALKLNDIILEIDNKSMTHRPDLWGQYGLAREIAALYKIKLHPLKVREVTPAAKKKVHVKVSTDKCPRYSALVIDGVTVGPSPLWLQRSLQAVGLRSINNIVDVTNYVMMELGQPMHAFDYTLLEGSIIEVKELKHQQSFQTLDGQKYKVPAGAIMIADGKKDIAIAGIMGGLNSEIKANTTTIVLESANFNASQVRRTSVDIGLRTDASARFEKALDPMMTTDAIKLAARLIQEVSPTAVIASEIIDVNSSDNSAKVITVSKDLIRRTLGVEIDPKTVKSILTRLAFTVKVKKDSYDVTVPSFRATKDVTIPVDVIEEIARMYGYGNIPIELPRVAIVQPEEDVERKVRTELLNIISHAGGYTEVYNYSFLEPVWTERLGMTDDLVEVRNAIADDLRFMRPSLIPALLRNAEDNMRWQDDFKLFEIGRIFKDVDGEYPLDSSEKKFLPRQMYQCAGVVVSKQRATRDIYFEVKGLLEQLFKHFGIEYSFEINEESVWATKVMRVKAHDQKFASFGLVAPSVRDQLLDGYAVGWWQINVAKLIKHANFGKRFSLLPKFPTVVRDISMIFDSAVHWEDIRAQISGISGLIRDVELFDIFESKELGHDKRSLAFSVLFRSDTKTLESKEIDTIMQKIIRKLQEKFKAELR